MCLFSLAKRLPGNIYQPITKWRKSFFNSFYYIYLTYPLWCSITLQSITTYKHIFTLEKIQHRGARWVCGSRYNCHSHTWSKSSSKCCCELHWPSLSIRSEYLTMVTIYDIIHCHISLPFSNYFSFSNSPTRSHSHSLQCKQSTINSYRYSFFVNGILHGILSLTKYLLCVVSPPLNMYYITFCVYSESLYSFWIVCIVCSALHHFFCFCILFFLYMPGLLELHCTQSGRYTVSYLLLHYCLRSVYKCCRDRKILMKIFLLITLLLFTI